MSRWPRRHGESEALVLADQLRPDLVLMDIQLAGEMDGIAAAQAIRERFAIPVVFLTAFVGDATLERAKVTEPFGYIIKPFQDRELRTVIEMALYKHQAETRLRNSHEELRTSEARYRKLFEEATEGIVLADAATGEILDCNQAISQLSGYDRLELIGKPQAVLHPAEEGNPTVSRTFPQHRDQQDGAVLAAELVTKAGEVRQVEIKANVLEIHGRKVMQGFFRDITAEARYHHERETTLKLLRLLNDPNNTHELVRSLTGFFQQWTGCEAVGIRLRDGDDFPYFETRGFPAEFVAVGKPALPARRRRRGSAGLLWQSGPGVHVRQRPLRAVRPGPAVLYPQGQISGRTARPNCWPAPAKRTARPAPATAATAQATNRWP